MSKGSQSLSIYNAQSKAYQQMCGIVGILHFGRPVHASERVLGLLAAPVRVGVHLIADALRTPAQMIRLLLVNRRTA